MYPPPRLRVHVLVRNAARAIDPAVSQDALATLGSSCCVLVCFLLGRQRSWIAYFTGGDRVYECDGGNENVDTPGNCLDPLRLMLNNNAEGRFRLEIAVRLLSGYNVASPWVTMIPVIPLPRGTQDAPKTRFQVREAKTR